MDELTEAYLDLVPPGRDGICLLFGACYLEFFP
jgi:hypothetical protein